MRALRKQTIALALALFAVVMQALAVPGVPCADMAGGMPGDPSRPLMISGHGNHSDMQEMHGMHQADDAHGMQHGDHDRAYAPAAATACCDHGDCGGVSCLTAGGALLSPGWIGLAPELRGAGAEPYFEHLPGYAGLLFRPPASR